MSVEVIEILVPHAGPMCLLEDIVAWDAAGIHCRSASHRRPDHPLRYRNRLGVAMLIEYAAQAVALHGGLTARDSDGNRSVAPGWLVALQDVRFAAGRGVEAVAVLDIHAWSKLSGPAGLIYDFEINPGPEPLVCGRLTVKHNSGPDS